MQRGSPPQVRGKPSATRAAMLRSRITPAGAGKTYREMREKISRQDHPRRCGENLNIFSNSPKTLGSPPQVREKLAVRPLGRHQERITPAGAGKTIGVHPELFAVKDHPRRCGENCQLCSPYFNAPGSPPQVRGKPFSFSSFTAYSRITPAGAGKTIPISMLSFVLQDHPRRCGENQKYFCPMCRRKGSPPQVRGKPPQLRL